MLSSANSSSGKILEWNGGMVIRDMNRSRKLVSGHMEQFTGILLIYGVLISKDRSLFSRRNVKTINVSRNKERETVRMMARLWPWKDFVFRIVFDQSAFSFLILTNTNIPTNKSIPKIKINSLGVCQKP